MYKLHKNLNIYNLKLYVYKCTLYFISLIINVYISKPITNLQGVIKNIIPQNLIRILFFKCTYSIHKSKNYCINSDINVFRSIMMSANC